MLTTVSFPSLRLGLHPTMDFSVSLIGCHVVHLHRTDMDSDSFLMEVLFQFKVWLRHFTEPEEMMEQSI